MNELLEACIDATNDWYRWGILADWFADQGDAVGEDWARWVMRLERKPWHSNAALFSGLWYWANEDDTCHGMNEIPYKLHRRWKDSRDNDEFKFIGHSSAQESYQCLLDTWRSFDDSTRAEFVAWEPTPQESTV
jgi:hypothetical protein